MEFKERIKVALKETNPWWKDKRFVLKDYSPRQVFSRIEKFFRMRQIIALVGLRRTGKTTILLKAIEVFLRQAPADNILYFSFDDFSLLDMEDLISAYKEIFPEINLKEGKFLFCLDEIQKLSNWEEKLKRIYDAYPSVKMLISGSESLFLRKKSKEALAGRIFEFKVSSLSFKEYLCFTKNDRMLKHCQLYKDELIKLYREFIKTNGFPELAGIKDQMLIHKYLKESIIDKILFQDIPSLFGVKNIGILGEILDIIIFTPGQIIDISRLSKELGLSRQVVSLYLDYLEMSFLVKKIYNYSKNLRKQKRSLKKYYPAVIFPSLAEDNFPACFENSLIWQMDIQFFYRDAYQNEVDALFIGEDKKIIPIEIKTGKTDLKGLSYFMKKHNLKEAIVLTLDKKEDREFIKLVPFYEFLLGEKERGF